MSVSTSLALPVDTFDPPRHQLGDYELIERVGQGGSAEVWLARRCVLPGAPKPCALKIIHGRLTRRPRFRRMFMREARLALKLNHANVVSVFDAGERDGRLFMALEWVDGVHLRDFAQHVASHDERIDIPTVCTIVGELLQGLEYAHGLAIGGNPLGVVHRDVAPHNVLVSGAGEIKLADFGIARVLDDASSGEHVKGHTRYMAPEQLAGQPTQGSDLFAVGAILHELLDGRRFREGLERRTDWHRVIAEAPLLPLSRPDVPPRLEALRVGLLQPDPSRRISSAEQALEYLGDCERGGPRAVQRLYARCVKRPRRTGLTRPLPTVGPAAPKHRVVAAGGATPRRTRGSRPHTATLALPRFPPYRPFDSSPAPPSTLRSRFVGIDVRLRRRLTSGSASSSWRPRGPLARLRNALWMLTGLLALAALGLLARGGPHGISAIPTVRRTPATSTHHPGPATPTDRSASMGAGPRSADGRSAHPTGPAGSFPRMGHRSPRARTNAR